MHMRKLLKGQGKSKAARFPKIIVESDARCEYEVNPKSKWPKKEMAM